ncbi:kinase-like protein [Glonium stellatum]|uniref:Kinase-like protein n=1 Tax=Glonium stellatum TaxID=574774 RepID=A0A8E2JU74_9PEZI|nr:kinase-like protein [Glonium stellatum]
MGQAPELYIPDGFTIKDIVAWGTSGMVFLDSTSNTVVKSPLSERDRGTIKIEREIYERFTQHGGHEGLLQYVEPFGTGIRLEFASNQGILPYIRKHKSNISFEQRLRWCEELSCTLFYIHSNKIIHGDLKCNNIFLDGALHSKVADFGGSSMDGSGLSVQVTASHRSPGVLNSIEGDLFALGSSFYEILTGEAPYAGREEDEIRSLFSESKFPEATTSLGPMGDIILGCWQGKYVTAHEVYTKIKVIRKRPDSLYNSPHALTIATAFVISGLCLFAVYWKRLASR